MPELTRPDGAVVHYEVTGDGVPLLLLAPGGPTSEIWFWTRAPIDPFAFADEFQVIAMDQRHAGGSHRAPLCFTYDQAVGDQLAVLDAVGAERAHVWGGCVGVPYQLRLTQDAPDRVLANVGQDPTGIDDTNSYETFTVMFRPTVALARAEGMDAVVDAALADPAFVMNNEAGPFARRIASDPAFAADLRAMRVEDYARFVESIELGLWPHDRPLFGVTEAWLATCPTPILVLPGRDEFHPTRLSERIAELAPAGRCLGTDWRDPDRVEETEATIRGFLREHSP